MKKKFDNFRRKNRESSDRPMQRKSMSQVFLTQDWPARELADQLRKWDVQTVLEIGPGGGALTRILSEAGFRVYAVEKDERFAEALKTENIPNVDIIVGDFLEFDLAAWCEEHAGKTLAIAGNIPYHLSTPMVLKALEMETKLVGTIFLVQEEFAVRMAAAPGNKDYGSLSVYVQVRAHAELLSKVSKGLFKPVPKVDSRLITMVPKNHGYTQDQLKRIEQIVRQAFQGRRKMLSNTLKSLVSGRDGLEVPVDLSLRPEKLAVEEFVDLAKALFPGSFPRN